MCSTCSRPPSRGYLCCMFCLSLSLKACRTDCMQTCAQGHESFAQRRLKVSSPGTHCCTYFVQSQLGCWLEELLLTPGTICRAQTVGRVTYSARQEEPSMPPGSNVCQITLTSEGAPLYLKVVLEFLQRFLWMQVGFSHGSSRSAGFSVFYFCSLSRSESWQSQLNGCAGLHVA